MDSVRSATESLLEERPELEDELEALLQVDAETESWKFDDISLDSGEFGEIVSRGLVKDIGSGYRVTDADAVRAAISEGEPSEREEKADPDRLFQVWSSPGTVLPSLEVWGVLSFVGVLLVIFLFRVIPYPDIFVDGVAVLSSNDPYFYRYLVEETITRSGDAFDFSVLSKLPSRAATGEPLLVAMLWFLSELAGDEGSVGMIIAWYPVVAALASAVFVYFLTLRLTDDRRATVAAMLFLAVSPGHAFRTGLGFGDHHALDYVWLALTVLALVTVYDEDPRNTSTLVGIGMLATGVAGQVLAWDSGPLLLVPLGLFAVAAVLSDVRADESPTASMGAVVAGLAVASVVVYLAHVWLGWHSPAVTYTPMLLLLGVVVVVTTGEAAIRFNVSPRTLVAFQGTAGAASLGVLVTVMPTVRKELNNGLEALINKENVVEAQSLFAGELGWILVPITVFGGTVLLAVPFLIWVSYLTYRDNASEWLAPITYCWYFLVLSVLQVRFAGQLSLFAAVFAGVGFLYLAAWIDITDAPTVPQTSNDHGGIIGTRDDRETGEPERELGRRELLSFAGLFAMTGGPGALFTPIKHSQVTTDDVDYRASRWMRAYSDRQEWAYPHNYVFSEWSNNRLYNYFVNGEAESYRFAQQNFTDFLQSTDGEEWYRFLEDERRSGFVVVSERPTEGEIRETMYDELVNNWGEQTSNYRALWTSEDESLRVYSLVPGATVTGPGEPGETIQLTLIAGIDGRMFEVKRSLDVNEFGVYTGTVPLPGMTDTGAEITVEDVTERNVVSGFDGDGVSHWAFDEGEGSVAHDRVGGYHGTVDGTEWASDEEQGQTLSFANSAIVSVSRDPFDREFDQFSFGIRFRTTEPHDWNGWMLTNMDSTGGFRLRINEGKVVGSLRQTHDDISPRVRSATGYADDDWHHAVVVFDGDRDQMKLYLDGKEADSIEWDGRVAPGGRLEIGASTYFDDHFVGSIAEVRIWRNALTPTDVEEYYEDGTRS